MPTAKRSEFVQKFSLGSLSGALSGSSSSREPSWEGVGDLRFVLLRWLKGQPEREGLLDVARRALEAPLGDLQAAAESLCGQEVVQIVDRPVDGNWKVRAS